MNALLLDNPPVVLKGLQEFIRHNGFNEHRVYVVVLVKNIFQRRLEEIPSARVDDNMGYIQTVPRFLNNAQSR
jgi:hypothetical protein